MPAGSVKTAKDEAAWDKAKAAAKESYPDIDTESDRYWAIVQSIYQKMKGGSSSHVEKALPPVPHPPEHQAEALRQYHEHVQASYHAQTQPLHPQAFGVQPHPAVEHYHQHVQAAFHEGQRPLHPRGFGVPHSEHLSKAHRSPRLVLLLHKAYVQAHTRRTKSGRTVTIAPYFTKRVAAHKEGAKERTRKPSEHPVPKGVYGPLHPEHLSARLVRHVEEGTMSHAEAHANLDHLERRAHAGHHLEHGHGPSWTPEETHAFIAHARGRLTQHKEEQEKRVKAEEARQQAARIEELTGKREEDKGAQSQKTSPRYVPVHTGVAGQRSMRILDTTTGEHVRHPHYGSLLRFTREEATAWADRENAKQARQE